MVRLNDRLCHWYARRAHRYLRHLEYEDVLQEARLAMAQAARFWQPEKGAKFTTYVSRHIQGKMSNLYRDQGRRLEPNLFGEEIEQMVQECGIDRWMRQQKAQSIVYRLLMRLEPRERQIIACTWGVLGEPQKSYREIGRELGITGARVGQIRAAAFKRLQEYAEEFRGEWEDE